MNANNNIRVCFLAEHQTRYDKATRGTAFSETYSGSNLKRKSEEREGYDTYKSEGVLEVNIITV